jgi:hypothetical protein
MTDEELSKCLEVEAERDIARLENERLRAALRYFVGCAYPVSTEINPRGHAWRGEDSLDFALGEAKLALGDEQEPRRK